MISVISRISDYGLDYSQRTNKLAHHIVVDAPLPNCGPAALLADPSIMRTQWDGNCINVPTPPALSATALEPAPCSTWGAITGDAGWGGVLANAWLNPSSKPIFVVFSEDQSVQVLSLIEEAIALLPPAKRWQATFGTYVTNLPPDVECKVRCVVAGSEEARMASARGVVINLTQAIEPAPQSEAVLAARNGTIIGARTSGPPSHAKVDRDEMQFEATQVPESLEYIEEASSADFDPDNPFANTTPDLPPSMRKKATRVPRMPIPSRSAKKLTQSYIGTAIIAGVLLISSLVGIAYYFSENSFLRGLDLGDMNTNNASLADPGEGSEAIESTRSNNADSLPGTVGGLSPPGEIVTPSITPPPPPPPLGHNEVEVGLAHERYLFEKPVAIRGQSVKAIVKGSKKTLTDEEKNYINEIFNNAKYEWKAVDSQSNPTSIQGSADKMITLSADSAAHELSLTISYKGEFWTAAPIRVIDAAKASDFNLKMTDFMINEKTIPFGVPGAKINAEVEIINKQEECLEYLGLLNSDTTITWHEDSGNEISKGLQYNVDLDNKYKSINAIAHFGDSGIKIQSDPKPIIAMLEGRIHFSMNGDKSNKLKVHVQEPVALVKPFQVRLERHRLKDPFNIDQLIFENDKSVGARSLRELESSAEKTTTLAQKLKGDYSQLEKLARESKGVDINKDFVGNLECLGDRSPGAIEIALSQKKFDDLENIVEVLNQLLDIAGRGDIDYKVKIAERCKPTNPADPEMVDMCREREKREVRFVEWLKGGELTAFGKQVVVEKSKTLRVDLGEIRDSIAKLSGGVDIVLSNAKRKLEIYSVVGIDEVKDEIGEFSIPIHLFMDSASSVNQVSSGESPSAKPFKPESVGTIAK
jgi:hypothetical protein